MEIRQILAYAENTRLLLRTTLEACPETWQQPFETTGRFQTVAQLAAHLVGAEQRWVLQRMLGLEGTLRYEDAAAETLSGLFADWDAIRARTLTLADDADLLRRHFTLSLGSEPEPVSLTGEEMFFHLANHQAWHLGQISMALQQQGTDPPNFDYVFLKSGIAG